MVVPATATGVLAVRSITDPRVVEVATVDESGV